MEFEIGDVIDVSIRLEVNIPEEDYSKSIIEIDNYEKHYYVDYSCARTSSSCFYDFTIEEGFSINDEVDSYIKEDLQKIYPEIAEYEIFDVNKDDFEYQSAKVRIKSLNM